MGPSREPPRRRCRHPDGHQQEHPDNEGNSAVALGQGAVRGLFGPRLTPSANSADLGATTVQRSGGAKRVRRSGNSPRRGACGPSAHGTRTREPSPPRPRTAAVAAPIMAGRSMSRRFPNRGLGSPPSSPRRSRCRRCHRCHGDAVTRADRSKMRGRADPGKDLQRPRASRVPLPRFRGRWRGYFPERAEVGNDVVAGLHRDLHDGSRDQAIAGAESFAH